MTRWAVAICALLLIAAWLVANHYQPWGASHSEVLAAAAAAALGVAGLGRSSLSVRVPWPVLFVAGLAVVPLIQAATGLVYFFGDVWIATLYLACLAWSIGWSAHLARTDPDRLLASFAGALVAGALLSSAVVVVQCWQIDTGPLALFIAPLRPGHAPYANLAQRNQLATLLALGLAGLMLLYERGWWTGLACAAAASVLTGAMVITQSRVGVLLFTVAFAWHVAFSRRMSLRTPRSVVIGLAAIWCAGFVAWPTLSELLGGLPAVALASRMQPGTRIAIWSQLWDAIWLRPWFGYGWNQVSVAQLAVAADSPRSELVEHSHNLLLDLLLWNGVPLGLFVVGIGLWWLVRSAARTRSVNVAFAWLAVVLLLTHAMVEFPLDYLYFLVPFGMALGIVAADAGSVGRWTLPRSGGSIALVAFVGVAGWAAADYWRVEEAYRDMRFSVARIGRVLPVEAPPMLATQFTQLAAFHHFALMPVKAHREPAELAWMRQVAQRFGYAPSLYRYALAQALNGDLPGARRTLQQLRQLHGEERYAEAKAELIQMAEQYSVLAGLNLP